MIIFEEGGNCVTWYQVDTLESLGLPRIAVDARGRVGTNNRPGRIRTLFLSSCELPLLDSSYHRVSMSE